MNYRWTKLICMSLAVFGLCAGQAHAVTTMYGPGAGFAILDNSSDSSDINVPDDLWIDDVTVSVDIDHTWVGDLVITLDAPGGSVVLADRAGSSDDLGGNYTFADGGVTFPSAGNPIPDGTPYDPDEPLSSLAGTSALGTWSLTVSDHAGGDTGAVMCGPSK